MTEFLERLAERPVVAVLRAPHADRFRDVTAVLHDAGIVAVEITMTTAGALDAIASVRSSLPPGMLVGAGTVRTLAQVHGAIDAGAQFLVSQITDAELIAVARSRGIPFIPGALTPNEIVTAWRMGVEAVKVSPVGPVGGLRYIAELAGPLPDIPLFPTGGVGIDEAAAYLTVGASIIGVSKDLVRDAFEPDGDLDALAVRARQVIAPVDERRALLEVEAATAVKLMRKD